MERELSTNVQPRRMPLSGAQVSAFRSPADKLLDSALDEVFERTADTRNMVRGGLKIAAITLWRGELAKLDALAARQLFRAMADMCDPQITIKELRKADMRRRGAVDRLVIAAEAAEAKKGETDGTDEKPAVQDVQGQAG